MHIVHMLASQLSFVALSSLTLPPPRMLGVMPEIGAMEISVPVSPCLSVSILEASLEMQASVVDQALDEATPVGSSEDPYGAVLWPAAQVVAGALVNTIEANPSSRFSVLELGAGTGLCSIAAMLSGAVASVATDYRVDVFELLRASAARTIERQLDSGYDSAQLHSLSTEVFDILQKSMPLPYVSDGPLIVCAADLLYMQSTSVALAARCVEALRLPNVELVLVGDVGRPGRPAFLEELVRQGVKKESAQFATVRGWAAPAPRHELISSTSSQDETPTELSLGLLQLTRADLALDDE